MLAKTKQVTRFKAKAVAIDLDGTLLNTAPDLAEAVNRMLVELGKPRVAESQVMDYVGRGAAKLIKGLLTGDLEGEPAPQLFQQALEVFFKHYDVVLDNKTTLYAGARAGVDVLKQQGLRLACITNKPARFTLPLLKSMGLLADFELVLSGDSLPEKKPHPMPLLHVCEQFGITPHRLVMIGDSSADVEAARAANCAVLAVSYGYNRGLGAEQLMADAVVDSILQATSLIEKA